MPTYSYVCDACGKSFEKEQRIIEDPIKVCELCGEPKARRQIVSGNFILKGSGWYSDGYGSAKSTSSSASGGSGTTASGASATSSDSTKSSETKSADTGTKPSDTGAKDSGSKPGAKASSKADAAE